MAACENCSSCGYGDGRICGCNCHLSRTEQYVILKEFALLVSSPERWPNKREGEILDFLLHHAENVLERIS